MTTRTAPLCLVLVVAVLACGCLSTSRQADPAARPAMTPAAPCRSGLASRRPLRNRPVVTGVAVANVVEATRVPRRRRPYRTSTRPTCRRLPTVPRRHSRVG
jgi:hypothetical protein